MRSAIPKHADSRLDHLGRNFNFCFGRASLPSSGLVVEAAFAKLQQESFKIFFSNLMEIKEQAGRITFKTAADIAAQMVIGQTKDIFAKIDPLTVGEDYRSNLIAEQYAIRLNLKANNLV